MPTNSFSRRYTAAMSALLSALGAVGLLLTGERQAGIGNIEPVALLVASVVLAAAAAGPGPGAASVAAPRWPPALGATGICVLVVLIFSTMSESGVESVLFFEVAAAICGVLFLTQVGPETTQ